MVSPEGNDHPLRDSSHYDLCSSIHLTFLVLCSTFCQVWWTLYAPAMVAARAPQGLSCLCSRDQAYWMTRQRLVFDVYVEEYAVHRVMRQFGLLQAAPVPAAPRLPPTAHR
jgi:hypothetical protein